MNTLKHCCTKKILRSNGKRLIRRKEQFPLQYSTDTRLACELHEKGNNYFSRHFFLRRHLQQKEGKLDQKLTNSKGKWIFFLDCTFPFFCEVLRNLCSANFPCHGEIFLGCFFLLDAAFCVSLPKPIH